jgi:hypothetical protein
MNLKLCASVCGATVIAMMALAAAPAAEAATKKKSVVTHTNQRVGTHRVAPRRVAVAGRPATRVIVRNRSFLDPGTESLPGSSHDNDYAVPPGYSPANVIINTPAYHRGPLPGPFELPSQNNPWPWNW